MAQDPNALIWIDMEMSGLDPEIERVLEIAVVITDSQLNTVAEAPVLVIHQPDTVLDAMDNWNKSTHRKSGLIDRVRASTLTEAQAEAQMIAFLEQHVPKGASPICGNSVHQDRRFLVKYLPQLDGYFHYRMIDVSTLKELARRWKPEVVAGMVKHGKHEALADIHESIAELRYYREQIMKI
ncbi:MAG: oligoribonuclease [Burkholderiales bacterium]|jgi:oligoribonuclease|nr:oligoribonuclease [Burkholderiales bacterium]